MEKQDRLVMFVFAAEALADGQSEHKCRDDGRGDDDSVRAVRDGLLMQLVKQKGPAENGYTGSRQHGRQVNPDTQSQQIADHAADDRAGHPERKPDKHEQADNTVFVDFVLVGFGGPAGTVGDLFQPFDDQKLPPDENEQRIKDQHQQRFQEHRDQ